MEHGFSLCFIYPNYIFCHIHFLLIRYIISILTKLYFSFINNSLSGNNRYISIPIFSKINKFELHDNKGSLKVWFFIRSMYIISRETQRLFVCLGTLQNEMTYISIHTIISPNSYVKVNNFNYIQLYTSVGTLLLCSFHLNDNTKLRKFVINNLKTVNVTLKLE